MKKLMLTLLPTVMVVPVVAATAEELKPNVLWIITDDHRADALECWNRATRGSSESELGYVSSPNIDRIAAEGVLFTASYCNSPVSGPSRASMHTGLYPHHNGIFNFQLHHNEHDRAQPIVPEVMRAEGYEATAFGKIGHYIYKYAEPMAFKYPDHYGQRISEREVEAHGFSDTEKHKYREKGKYVANCEQECWYYEDGTVDSYLLFTGKNRKALETPENSAKRAEIYKKHEVLVRPQGNGNEIIGGLSPMPTDKTQDGRIAEEFCRYLDNADRDYISVINKEMKGPTSDKPQFIQLGFHFPHTPVLAPKEYRDIFKTKEYKIPEFDESEVDKMSKQVQGWYRTTNISSFNEAERQQMVQDYYAFCAMGDELIGKAVDKFKEYCAERNQPYTIVIACGDHGWHLGEQGTVFKCSGFLKSNQTAVIVVSSDKSKFPSGKVVGDFVEYVDLAPTIYATAGCDLSSERFSYLDGRDLYLTANEKIEPKEYVIGETQLMGGHRAYLRCDDFAFSMRTRKGNGNPTLEDLPNSNVKWPMECSPEEADLGLYDLRVDPNERNNVAYDPKYRELAEWMRVKLGNIVLGDDRFEMVWSEKNLYNVSSFAKGSDTKKMNIPKKIIPKI